MLGVTALRADEVWLQPERFAATPGALLALDLTSAEGFDGLATVAGNLSAVRAALDAQLMQIAAQIVQTATGSLKMDRTALLSHPGEVQRRLLVAALRWVSNAEYAPRADAVARLIDKVRTGGDATLSGCSIRAGGPVLRGQRR